MYSLELDSISASGVRATFFVRKARAAPQLPIWVALVAHLEHWRRKAIGATKNVASSFRLQPRFAVRGR